MAPTTMMKALLLTPATKDVSVDEIPVPEPSAGEILVRAHAIALNVVDSLFALNPLAEQEKRVLGTDWVSSSGPVTVCRRETSGPSLAQGSPPSSREVSDGVGLQGRVPQLAVRRQRLTSAGSANDRPGAFAEYLVIAADLTWRVPASMPLDSAATVSMCSVTAAQGVFYRQGLPCPFWKTRGFDHEGDINYLVYGASSSLGMYAAQMVRIAACPSKGPKVRLIGVASKGKHDFLRKEYGYDELVDYRDNDWVERVKALGGADYAFDAISEGDTFANIQAAPSPRAKEGSVVVFVSPPEIKYKVAPTHGSAWEALGVEISFMGRTLPADANARAFAAAYYKYIGEHPIKPNSLRRMPGGLEKVHADGFAVLGAGLVATRGEVKRSEEYMKPISGEKMVYTLVKE